MDLADDGTVRREAVHAVVPLSGLAGSRPQVAVPVGADPVRRRGSHVGEDTAIRNPVAIHIENRDVGGVFGAVGTFGGDPIEYREMPLKQIINPMHPGLTPSYQGTCIVERILTRTDS